MRKYLMILILALGSSGPAFSQGPIAWFSFETPGNLGEDTAGSHDAIEVVGVTQTAGVSGHAGSFVFGYMQLPDTTDLQLLEGDFTLSLFVRSSDLSNRNWFTKSTTVEHRYGLGTLPGGHIGLLFNGNSLFGLAMSTTVVFDGAWHHVAGLKRGSMAELWVDGRLEGTSPINSIFTDDGAFAVGRDGQCCEYFNGFMDEVKIWSRALTPEEIAAEATGDVTELVAHLIGYVDQLSASGTLNTGQGNALKSKLRVAQRQIEHGDPTAAINQLKVFIQHVENFVSVGILTPSEGEPLIETAQNIVSQLS
jgi:hypothetical protein